MVNKSGRGGGDNSLGENVVSMFNARGGPSVVVSSDDTEAQRLTMLESLEMVRRQVESGDVTGMVIITIRNDPIFGGESYIGGNGLWGAIDRAIGVIEMVKMSLLRAVRGEDIG